VIKGEKEILLHPNMAFLVYDQPFFDSDGYYIVNMSQIGDSKAYIY